MDDKEIKKYLKRIADSSKPRRIVINAIINGIFTALGATIGFALVVIFLAYFLASIKNLPIIDELIRRTKIDQLINNQLSKLENDTDYSTRISFTTNDLALTFNYPFGFIKNAYIGADNAEITEFLGGGELRAIKLFVSDKEAVPEYDAFETIVLDKVIAGKSDFRLLNNDILFFEINHNNKYYTFYGFITDPTSNSAGLNLFKEVIESIVLL